ncbi:MAG TPA: formate dehydrogenase accessory sulfurtransferase FdhD [Microlunatus sp.]|nr:formate dehydrogenase accessory sulfurtransferase FdhD [Microlunatus sp.]
MGRVTTRHPVLHLGPDSARRRIDTLAVEEPLEIRLDGSRFVVTMRTPGHDIELVHGLLHSEGVIASAADVRTARYCAGADEDGRNTYNVLDVSLAEGATPDVVGSRSVITTSACGICGTDSIEQLQRRSRYALEPSAAVPRSLLEAGPELLREAQRTFAQTGGLHAAGLLAPDGTMLCVREDVGRHNAVDKAVGWALQADRLPLRDVVLVVSGRASYELTQKAVLAGIGVMVAVSAPSSLAVELAATAGLTLVGFVRGASMNIYTHPGRVIR